ncbi:recombinase zinc beta ribbon domain-containing protein [Kitasatospora acidiphila]|nr:recombinase zinc beta ribbon domain-containing protein [Kitasatospora acidiphila]
MYGFEDSRFSQLRDSEVPAVRGAASRRLLGQNKAEIAEWMNSEGYRGTRGAAWTSMTLGRLLRSPEIAGLTVGENGELVESGKPVIITPEEFRKLQALDTETARAPRQEAYDYLYTGGMAVCGECKQPMTSARSNSDTPGYRCGDANRTDRPGGCGKTRIAAGQLEDYVAEYVLAELLRPSAQEEMAKVRQELGAEAEQARARIEELKGAAGALADSYLNGEVTRETIVAVEQKAKGEIKQLRTRLRFLEQAVAAPQLGNVDDLIKWWNHAPTASKRAIAMLFLISIEVYKASAQGIRHIEPGRVVLKWRREGQ